MSHFTVTVIGPDIESQLAPFHEFECTGLNDHYVQNADITEEVLQRFQDFLEEGVDDPLKETIGYWGYETAHSEEEVDIDGTHKDGYMIVVDGKIQKAVQRTNPNAKWDWWRLGGRWTGFLKLKPDTRGSLGEPGLMTAAAAVGYADSARKGDVDWEGMRNDAAQKAADEWDRVKAAAAQSWDSWKSVRSRFDSIEDARSFYHGQSGLKAVRESELEIWDYDRFLVDRDKYVQEAHDAATLTFAFLMDGNWVERGEMGWFGCVSNEKDKENWDKEFNLMFDALSDDTLISIVDCHI